MAEVEETVSRWTPLVASGTVALDSVETPHGSRARQPGGSALYFAAAAAPLGPVSVVGVAGDDFPAATGRRLEGLGVHLDGLAIRVGRSMTWHAIYSSDLENRRTLATDRGVARTTDPVVPPGLRSAPAVFLGSQDPRVQASLLEQMTDPSLVGLDTMSHWVERAPRALHALLQHATVLFVNDSEARLLGGATDLGGAARALRRAGTELVVVKHGAQGASVFWDGPPRFAPAWPVGESVDPTGAGDAFAGGFMGRLARAGEITPASVAAALCTGNAAGSLAVSSFGLDGLVEGATELLRRADLLGARVTPRGG